jgi:hypothetical protein
MTPTQSSQSKSKAQRRAEAQRKAAEKRAAEQRRRRTQIGIRVGGVAVVIVAVIVLAVVLTGGSSGPPPSFTNPHISPPLQPIPASMSSSWTQPPAETPGPETVGLANATKLANLDNMANGQTINGVQCQTNEQTVVHVHTHLTIFVNGKQQAIPYGVGIPGAQAQQTPQGPFVATGSCFYWLHTHATDGILHIESPSTTMQFTLGQFFAEWGIPLSSTQVGPASGTVTTFFTSPGHKTGIYTGDPSNLPLGNHYEIQLEVGSPIVAPYKVTNWGGL